MSASPQHHIEKSKDVMSTVTIPPIDAVDESRLERFSYDLEMKTGKQNRNDKRTEIERFDWFIEQTDKRAWLFIG